MKAIRRLQQLKKNSADAKVLPMSEYILNFDGSSKGNPGLAGAGVVIYKNSEEICAIAQFLGHKTNNQSEYTALIIGLQAALNQGIDSLCVLGDSLLVINQINGIYRVTAPLLLDLYEQVKELKLRFRYIEFNHVYREYNVRADELSNLALLNIDTKEIKVNEVKVDEECIEEIKLEPLIIKKKTRLKQTTIQKFFKINTLFPDINI